LRENLPGEFQRLVVVSGVAPRTQVAVRRAYFTGGPHRIGPAAPPDRSDRQVAKNIADARRGIE
jgi:hypothetical protein